MRIVLKLKMVFFALMLFACEKEVATVQLGDKSLKLDNGVLMLNDKPFTGVLQSKNSQMLAYEAQYLNGKKHGEEKKYFNNGLLAEERFYTKGEKSGTHKAWWSNKQLKFEYHFDDAGNYIGQQQEWYSNGKLLKETNYVEGKEQGTQKMWDSKGNVLANYIVTDGERFGLIGTKKCKSEVYGFD